MKRREFPLRALLFFTLATTPLLAQQPDILEPGAFSKRGKFALVGVSVIDGTGAPAKHNQTVIINDGLIRVVGAAGGVAIPEGTERIELPGRTVIPGLIMMHEHIHDPEHAPALYLANGVTTVRTGGSFRPFEEVNLRQWIREGRVAGPELFLASPFVSEKNDRLIRHKFVALRNLKDEKDARTFVRYWAGEGFDFIKVYRGITPRMLRIVTEEAHRNGIRVMGHLEHRRTSCVAAAEASIDSIEHTVSNCVKDVVDPNGKAITDPAAPAVRARLRQFVDRKVAIVETPVDLRPMTERELDVLTSGARAGYLRLAAEDKLGPGSKKLNDEAVAPRDVEAAFFEMGGRFLLGSDSGPNHRLPGFMNIHSLISLRSAFGFTALEAIQIATSSAAAFLGISDRTGRVATGKEADLVVINGDPTKRIADLRNIELVFVDGVRHDPAQLLQSVKGKYDGKSVE